MSTTLYEAFKSDIRHEEVIAELVELEFKEGYESYTRPALIVSGPHGQAEASPLTGYFDDVQTCVSGAISSVLDVRPEIVREVVAINQLVSNENDIEKLDNPVAIKVKVASFDDVDLVKKVRDYVGITIPVRIDCNGKFDLDNAQSLVAKLKDVNLEFIEQPCKTIEENSKLRQLIEIPLALDESACTISDIEQIKKFDAGDIIVVKVQSSGGFNAAFDAINFWGTDVVISSMMESEVGLNLGIELAKCVETLPYACGLSQSPIKSITNKPFDIA